MRFGTVVVIYNILSGFQFNTKFFKNVIINISIIRIIKITHVDYFRFSRMCDKYSFTYFEYGYNVYWKKVNKYITFTEIYILDFKKYSITIMQIFKCP